MQGWKSLLETNTLAYWTHLKVTRKRKCCEYSSISYSQHFIFFITYEWAQHVEVLHYTRLRKLARDIHSSLLDPFEGHKEKEVL